ncbi:MAG: hypothetical protein PVH61_22830 [Candidatus Aminicenantes bacterium]|jgi:hypothetical protein
MAINADHITGFIVGAGTAALGYYLYKKNQDKIDAFLRQYGIDVKSGSEKDWAGLSMEELVAEKERMEDLIAEREMAAKKEPGKKAPA